jgi:hypothetical protein
MLASGEMLSSGSISIPRQDNEITSLQRADVIQNL